MQPEQSSNQSRDSMSKPGYRTPALSQAARSATSQKTPTTPPRVTSGEAMASSSGRVATASAPEPFTTSETSQPVNPPPARAPTLTQKMRAVQPPDVARQVMRELEVLSEHLERLPEQLEQQSLTHTHAQSYLTAVRAYTELSGMTWEAVAEERLEQSGAEPDFRQRAISTARRVSRLQQECQAATRTDEFQLPRSIPALWRARLRLVNKGMDQWREHLTPTPRARELGRAYLFLRGYIGLASTGRLELAMFRFLSALALILPALTGIGFLLQCVAALLAGDTNQAGPFGIATLFAALVEIFLALLVLHGSVPLGVLLGARVFAPIATARDARWAGPWHAWAQRVWLWVVSLVGLVASCVALAMAIMIVLPYLQLQMPVSAAGWCALVGSLLATVAGLPATTVLAAVLALALPVQIVAIARFALSSARHSTWVPEARRYALESQLCLLATCVSLLVVAVWLLTTATGLGTARLFTLRAGSFNIMWSWRTLCLLLALTVPYVALLDLPFRLGMRRWRTAWLGDLIARRTDVEAHVRRLSVADPVSGLQDTSEENLRAMQYDLVLLQFYRDRVEEAEQASAAPFPLGAVVAALVIMLACAWLLDSVSAYLVLLAAAH